MSWYEYYGLRFGMSRAETINLRFGEMMDLIACDAIYSGMLEPKQKKQKLGYDEAIALR